MSAREVEDDSSSVTSQDGRSHKGRISANLLLAGLAVVGAFAVVGYAFLRTLGTAGCTHPCDVGPSETVFGLIVYGTPIVAVVALVVSFFTARKRLGFVIPLISWIVVLAALITLIVTF